MIIYQNKWCKIEAVGTYYVLKRKSGKYNDQYFLTLDETKKKMGIPTAEQAAFLKQFSLSNQFT